ncbi:MAG: TonB-dependent receptor, partial [Bacteroidales bacterium]
DVFFSSGTNDITSNVKNEKNFLTEAGYRFTGTRTTLEATVYYACWKNKTLLSDPYKQQDNSTYLYMVQGLDALHYGVEITAGLQAARWLRIEAGASFGSWTWKNDVSANIYDPYSGILTDRIDVYCDGLKVGDSPQTQCMASIEVLVIKGLYINADWTYNGRLYADFDPAGRTDPNDRANSLRLPDYHLVNMSVTWNMPFGLTLLANLNNLTNETYIERGKDGADHTLESFRGYWGFGINGSLGLRIDI